MPDDSAYDGRVCWCQRKVYAAVLTRGLHDTYAIQRRVPEFRAPFQLECCVVRAARRYSERLGRGAPRVRATGEKNGDESVCRAPRQRADIITPARVCLSLPP